jgi:hypothetical protein
MATPKKAKKETKADDAEVQEEAPEAAAPVAAPEAKHPCAKCGTKVAAYETVGTDGKGYCSMGCFVARNG